MSFVEQCGDFIVRKLLEKLPAETGVLAPKHYFYIRLGLVLGFVRIGLVLGFMDWFGPTNAGKPSRL